MPRVVLTLLALIALAVPAAADAKRKVPQGFMGVNFDRAIAYGSPPEVFAAQFPRMASSGVESVRTNFYWSTAQPAEDGPIDLSESDNIVGLAAASRIRVLPVVILAPEWARMLRGSTFSPARNPASIRPYARALVDRYGPRGSFWTEHPELPRLPIRHWQFWNEPHFDLYWPTPKRVRRYPSYVARLKAFRGAVRSRDGGAKIVLAGLANASWRFLKKIYKAGGKPHFDIVAVHPFTVEPMGVITIVRYVRRVMKKRGDAKLQVWLTELSLPASKGKVSSRSELQTTDRGMARWLTAAYREIVKRRRDREGGAQRVYWYTWATEYADASSDHDIFRFAGLLAYNGGGETQEKPAHGAFVRVARDVEGCTKTSTGLCE